MKMFFYCITLLTTLLAGSVAFSASVQTTEDRHAVEITIGSIGTGVDAAAYRKLRAVIGNAVSNNVIDKFVIYGYGKEGGFSACVEDRPGSAAPGSAFENLVKKLNAITPKTGTIYSINRIQTCPALPLAANKPATVQVAKSDGSIACEPNSGAALSDTQKELGEIAVYAAEKLSDGLIRPAVCGIATGEYNVYEIAETDRDQAIALGFVLWSEIAGLPATQLSLPLKSPIALNTAAATTYACSTLTINGQDVCLKYRVSPLPLKYIGIVANTACPNNPPSNCP